MIDQKTLPCITSHPSSHNDEHNVVPLWDNPRRRPLERLVRKLLDYPLRQAVIFLHTYDWHEVTPKAGASGHAEGQIITEIVTKMISLWPYVKPLALKDCSDAGSVLGKCRTRHG